MLKWLRQWLGLPPTFEGVVYDTASISTMHALAAAQGAGRRINPRGTGSLGTVSSLSAFTLQIRHTARSKRPPLRLVSAKETSGACQATASSAWKRMRCAK